MRNVTATEYFDFKTGKDHCYILAGTPLKQSEKKCLFLSPRIFKEQMFQDRIILNSQLLTTEENNAIK